MATDKRTGMTLPKGILAPTTPPEPSAPVGEGLPIESESVERPVLAVQGGEAKSPRVRRKKSATTTSNEKLEGRRLYLSERVHFRLRMLAYQRGQKISEVAEDVLDKALPLYDVNRVG